MEGSGNHTNNAAETPDSATLDPDMIVAAHNKLRREVGVEGLSYSAALAASAQAWANILKNTYRCQLRHSHDDGSYGENLYWASAIIWSDGRRDRQPLTANNAVTSWAGEKSDYDHGANRCRPGKNCGHYTQLVWKSTRQVGCGYAVCDDSKEQVWVCQYRPAGNLTGERPY